MASSFSFAGGAQDQRLAASGGNESEFSTLASTSTAHVQDEAQGLPGIFVSIATTVVAALLSPFIGSGTGAPAEPPLLWAVLEVFRREIHRIFFNRTPGATDDAVTTSEDLAKTFTVLGNDADDDPLTHQQRHPTGQRHRVRSTITAH